MEGRRPQRVADQLLHETADILQKHVKDPRVGFVTLTGAQVSPDLRNASLYYTVLGEPTCREETAKGLSSAAPFIRRELGRRLRLKAVPEIRFLFDEAIERGFRVQDILEQIDDDPVGSDR